MQTSFHPTNRTIFCATLLFIFISCQTKKNKTSPLLIASSANMQYAAEALAEKFFENHGTTCELIVASSGKLTAQIKEGAPFDLFLAADRRYPEEIEKKDLALQPSKIYAYGSLVLFSGRTETLPDINILANPNIRHIAIANPLTAPYGKIAKEGLIKMGVYDILEDKLVVGESLSQTTRFVTSGAAEIGFISKSIAISTALKGKGEWIELDVQYFPRVAQGAVILKKEGDLNPMAERFYNFLFSEEAREILKDFGYSTDESIKRPD